MMMARFGNKTRRFFVIVLSAAFSVFLAGVPESHAQKIREEIQAAPELVNQANAPLSSIMQLRFRNIYTPHFVDMDGRGNILNIDVTMPLPAYRLLPIRHLTLLTAPTAVTIPGGRTGFGDLRFMDLAIVSENEKFIFGLGPSFVFPTATDRRTGQGKWQAGPAAGAAIMSKRLMAGVIAQNPMSFAGDEDRPSANYMILQPFVTYQLGKGWFVRSQPPMFFDWRTGNKILPLDLGVGRTFKIGSQNVNCFVQPFWNFSSGGHPPLYGINAGLSFLFPDFWKKIAQKSDSVK